MPVSSSEPADRIITRFLRSHRNDWSDANIANACWVLNKVHAWLAAHAAGVTLTHPDPDELVDALDTYITDRLGEVKANSVRVEHRQLCAFYKWATREQPDGGRLVARNPMLHIACPDEEAADPADKPVAQEWQYDALLATCHRRRTRNGNKPMNDRRDAAIIAVLWHTGMRRSELCNLDYERIDFGVEQVFLPRTKGGSRKPKSRWVTLPPDALELIDLWIDERGTQDGPLFGSATHPGRRLAPQSVTLILRRRAALAARTLGKDPADIYTPAHSFRRASAIEWLANGGSETGLMRNHGWSTRKMIDTYTETEKDRLTAEEARRMAAARKARHLRAV